MERGRRWREGGVGGSEEVEGRTWRWREGGGGGGKEVEGGRRWREEEVDGSGGRRWREKEWEGQGKSLSRSNACGVQVQ